MTTRDPTTKALSAGVYGGLVGVVGSTFANQPVLGVQPDLADSWEIQPDGLKYTSHIRPDAMITEPINRPMDSGDVLYSFNHHQGLDGLEPAPERGQFAAAIGGWEAVDASSFVINMTRPQASFMDRLADIFTITMMPVESRPGGSFDPANTMIGYGPFMLESADADTGYTLKRNPNWWQAKAPGLDIPWFDGVEATVVPSSANRLLQLKSGSVDYAGNQDPNSLPELQEEVGDALKIWPYKALGWGLLAFGDPRDGSAPWAEVRVRRAISLALDRDPLDEVVYNTSKLDAAGFDVSSKLNRHGALSAGWPGQSIDPREDPKIGDCDPELLAGADRDRLRVPVVRLGSADPLRVRMGRSARQLADPPGAHAHPRGGALRQRDALHALHDAGGAAAGLRPNGSREGAQRADRRHQAQPAQRRAPGAHGDWSADRDPDRSISRTH